MANEPNQFGPTTGKHPDHYLAEWRLHRGMSQMELAEMAEVSHSTISRLETGQTELRPSFLKKLAKILRASPVAILTINPLGEGRRTADMLDLWNQADARKQRRMKRMMKTILEEDEDDPNS